MQKNKRRQHLTTGEKTRFVEAALRFKSDVAPLFCSLTAFGAGYKALHTISEAIDAAYGKLEIEKPDPRFPYKPAVSDEADPAAK